MKKDVYYFNYQQYLNYKECCPNCHQFVESCECDNINVFDDEDIEL